MPFVRCLTAVACALASQLAQADTGLYLGSKTPYEPRQDAATYEAAPSGFSPVFTQMVARHGSRGLSSASNDLAFYNMWLQAQATGNLTKLGARLGPELMRVVRANALLGYGVNGITVPGYGNLTLKGIDEHTQLAKRMAARVGPLLTDTASTASRQVVVSTSGVNRAIDSGNFFTSSLASAVPGLAPLIVNSAALTAYPSNKPVAQAAGINRFQLYFHKLAAKTDLPVSADAYYPTYQASLAYQSYLASDATMLAKVNAITYSASTQAMARTVLEGLFTKAFVNALDAGASSYANTGSYTFTSDDGKFTTTVTGDGGTVLRNLVDAANALYAVYTITPAMVNEVPVNLGKYFPAGQLPVLAYVSDAQDFYQKGPGVQEAAPVTYKMSQSLLDDFFREADAIAAGNLGHAAKLRFTHAEIMIPFAQRLGLPNATTAVPAANTYTYDNNPWRGENIAPLAGNVQWDMFGNGAGTLLVKMYFNEKETDFPAACDNARYFAGASSHYYEYSKLKACYGY
ncbi:MAG: histidine-type phosphatase [Aquabacterium sp.]